MMKLPTTNSTRNAFTLLEICVASSLAALLFTSLFTLSAQLYSFIGSAKQTSYATQVLEARVESLRSLTWVNLASKSALQSVFSADAMKMLAISSGSSTSSAVGTATANFTLVSERLIATPYYAGSTSPPSSGTPVGIELIRNANGSFAALPASDPNTGSTLTQAPAIKLRLTVSWSGSGGRLRQRETTTFISRYGL